MGEAKRRAQLDPTFGIKPRKGHTRQMLKDLNRRELEDLTASLGLWMGRVLTQTSNFIGDIERDEYPIDLHYPSYIALKEEVEAAIDWLEAEDAA